MFHADSGAKARLNNTAKDVTRIMQQCTQALKMKMEEHLSSPEPPM